LTGDDDDGESDGERQPLSSARYDIHWIKHKTPDGLLWQTI